MGLSSLSNMIRGEELVNALAKVKSFIPADRAKDIELKSNQIAVDLTPVDRQQEYTALSEMIKTALQESRLLSFEYEDRHGNKTTRTAEPYQLVLKGSHWYWQGYCHKRNDFRLFKLSRISNLHIQDEFFTPGEYQKPQLEFADILSSMQTRIKIRIHKSVRERVLITARMNRFFRMVMSITLSAFLSLRTIITTIFFFSFGDKCECLEPLQYPHGDEAPNTGYRRPYTRAENMSEKRENPLDYMVTI